MVTKNSTTIRISRDAWRKLKQMSLDTDMRIMELIDELVEEEWTGHQAVVNRAVATGRVRLSSGDGFSGVGTGSGGMR